MPHLAPALRWLPVPAVLFSAAGRLLFVSKSLTLDESVLNDIFARTAIATPPARFRFSLTRGDGGVADAWEAHGSRVPDGRLLVLLVPLAHDVQAEQEARENHMFRRMLAVFAHEFRNPLSVVKLALEAAQRRAMPSPPAAPGVQVALGAGARAIASLERMVADIADYRYLVLGRMAFARAAVDVGALVERSVDDWRARSGRRIELRWTSGAPEAPGVADASAAPGPTEALTVWGDEGRLRQAVDNVVHNALKFSPATHAVVVSLGRDGAQLRLAVADRGIGMDADAIASVSKAFYQHAQGLGRAQGGFGLGGYVTGEIVRAHAGTVAYDSPGPGQGTTVVVRLPLARPDDPAAPDDGGGDGDGDTAAPPLPLPSAAPEAGACARRVLIVEDDADALALYDEMLARPAGTVVDFAPDAQAAWQAFCVHGHDVVVTDIGLPGASGYELIERIRAEVPASGQPRVVVVSGYSSEADRVRGESLAVDERLTKPVSIDALQRVVDGRGPT